MLALYNWLEANELLDLPNEDAATMAASVSGTDIQSADVRTYFREQLLWYQTDPSTMAGSIQTALDSGSLPAELVGSLGEMWSSLYGGAATRLLTNSRLEISVRIHGGITALVAVGVFTADQLTGFYDLGGGLLFPGTTAADVQQAKDDKAAADAAADAEEARLEAESALRQKWDDAMIDAGAEEAFYNGDEAALITAINAAVQSMTNKLSR